jgi:hypothetical protein
MIHKGSCPPHARGALTPVRQRSARSDHYGTTLNSPCIVGQDLPLQIERVEPGKLYFIDVDGPLRVPRGASDLAKPGWDVTISLIRQRGTWKVLEVGNVYPH